MKREVFNILFREKPALILTTLRDSKSEIYASSLAKKIDCTYSHVVKLLQFFEKEGIINFDKQGRLKLLVLTKKGNEIAEHISKIKSLV